ncbi:SusD/RagB family nutrient-binding outer membrane lipoprotein [Zobellia galactanivorans]|uniref:SusD/RagB family lipoprotein n=1 Tax=Zobellia galactanivorans (strain DSM 12802 / CCUG 47099 / CIP 106680 / NCIMB 13871 / Dsij) TaxID=63186 RepID=G0L612_ZOBGA|nr:SusD/RagB family nutrient-binding outer membrane lipoprotein [Zobellia galactanivorans]MDO6807110.1 SusD/RagB family nutrient-binding outer membrane lipoprotein [Zobellia galactanivorans]CAZ96648.1 SusD/RagB family lipoprotein [Zobellia galactanivorans]
MKKIYNILNKSLLVFSFGILATSCSDDFYDVNDNPNDPSISTPIQTLPTAQVTFASLNGTSMTYVGNMFVYNWATPSNWSANSDFFRYNVSSSFYTNIFETSYSSIFKNLTYIENYEDPTGAVDYSAYDVIAQTMKGFQYQYLVDLYGDVPFSEANLRAENTTPVYDDAETVYKSVIDSLTRVATMALDLPENAETPGDSDIFFGGDMEKWAQFANTIKLRMLVRLSNTGQDTYIKEQIGLIDANGAGYIQEDVMANPGYSKNADKQSPFYDYAGWDEGDAETNRHDYTVATDHTVNYLSATNDPRLGYLYSPSENSGTFKGVWQAINLPGSGYTSKDLSKIGSGLLKSPTQDQPIMLLAEALLLRSEAIVRGYINGSDADAKQLYNDAITASFEYLEVEDAATEAETYYSQAIKNTGWDASTDKIEAIITQKWVVLNGTSSIESWIENTRTGFPVDLPVSGDSDGVRPVSLLYPTSEYSRNSQNVPPTTREDAFTKYPFWK